MKKMSMIQRATDIDLWQSACLYFILEQPHPDGLVFVVNGTRRCGKTTLAKRILDANSEAKLIVTSMRLAGRIGPRAVTSWQYDMKMIVDTLVVDGIDHLPLHPAPYNQLLTTTRHLILLRDSHVKGFHGNGKLVVYFDVHDMIPRLRARIEQCRLSLMALAVAGAGAGIPRDLLSLLVRYVWVRRWEGVWE